MGIRYAKFNLQHQQYSGNKTVEYASNMPSVAWQH